MNGTHRAVLSRSAPASAFEAPATDPWHPSADAVRALDPLGSQTSGMKGAAPSRCQRGGAVDVLAYAWRGIWETSAEYQETDTHDQRRRTQHEHNHGLVSFPVQVAFHLGRPSRSVWQGQPNKC